MRNLKVILIIVVTAGILTMYLPWWMIAVTTFAVTVNFKLKPLQGFTSGFLAIALLWLVLILIKDVPNEHILSARMAGLLGLPNSGLFILVNVLLGALIGGFSGWSGAVMNKAFRKA